MEDHLLRKIDKYIDFDFIYDLVEEKAFDSNWKTEIDPVTLIKIPIIQYMYGINSMRSDDSRNRSQYGISLVSWIGFYDKVLSFQHIRKNEPKKKV